MNADPTSPRPSVTARARRIAASPEFTLALFGLIAATYATDRRWGYTAVWAAVAVGLFLSERFAPRPKPRIVSGEAEALEAFRAVTVNAFRLGMQHERRRDVTDAEATAVFSRTIEVTYTGPDLVDVPDDIATLPTDTNP